MPFCPPTRDVAGAGMTVPVCIRSIPVNGCVSKLCPDDGSRNPSHPDPKVESTAGMSIGWLTADVAGTGAEVLN